jgi:hypothetical protein
MEPLIPKRMSAVTPSDTQQLSNVMGLLVTAAGNLVFQCGEHGDTITLPVTAGMIIPGSAFYVMAASTASVASLHAH